jgi:hypothetical protein
MIELLTDAYGRTNAILPPRHRAGSFTRLLGRSPSAHRPDKGSKSPEKWKNPPWSPRVRERFKRTKYLAMLHSSVAPEFARRREGFLGPPTDPGAIWQTIGKRNFFVTAHGFDSISQAFGIWNVTATDPRVRSLVDDGGSNLVRCDCIVEDESGIKLARLHRSVEATAQPGQ